MELRQVRYFVGIAREGSFARAADELHVVKSALSRQIKQLEAELGVELFIRGGGRREVKLTPAGEAFLPEAVTITQAVDEGMTRARAAAGADGGAVTVTVNGGWEAWPGWEDMIGAFRDAHPGMALKLGHDRSSEETLEGLRSGDADLSFLAMIEPPSDPDLEFEVLFSERILVALPPDHKLAGRTRIRIADLRRENWILRPMERELMTEVARPMGFNPRVEIDAPTHSIVRSLVLRGEGITFMGQSEVPFFEPAAFVEVGPPPLDYSIVVAYRRASRNTGTRAVRDFLRAQFAGATAAESATSAG